MNEYAEAKILQFENMLQVFGNLLTPNPTITERTAAIKNFEFTYELSWKAMKRLEFREAENLPITTSVIKKAFKYGLTLELQKKNIFCNATWIGLNILPYGERQSLYSNWRSTWHWCCYCKKIRRAWSPCCLYVCE